MNKKQIWSRSQKQSDCIKRMEKGPGRKTKSESISVSISSEFGKFENTPILAKYISKLLGEKCFIKKCFEPKTVALFTKTF